MLLLSIFQLFYEDPDLKHVGMTREDETAALPTISDCGMLTEKPLSSGDYIIHPIACLK
jgi:hypothetical protein